MSPPTSTWRRLAPFADHGPRRLLTLVVTSLLAGGAEAGVLVLVTRLALAATRGEGQVEVLGVEASAERWALLSLGLVVLKLAMGVAVAVVTSRLAAGSLSGARRTLVRAFLHASWDRQSRDRPGALQELMTTNVDKVASIFLTVGYGVTAAVNLAILLVVAVVVNPAAALGVMVAGAALLALLSPVSRLSKRNAGVYVTRAQRYASEVAETVSLARELSLFGTAGRAAARIDDAERTASESYRRSRFLGALLPQLFQGLALAFVAGAIGIVVTRGDTDVAGLGAVVVLLLRCLAYGQQASVANQQLAELLPHLDRLATVEDEYRTSAAPRGTERPAHLGRLVLRDVGYSYGDVPALHGVDLAIEPGEVIGVVGPSGGGKSTLVHLLLGLRPPTTGTIEAGGVSVQAIDPMRWSELVAAVPQEGRCFAGTVADNIAFLRDSTPHAVEAAARAAHLHDEIVAWPEGYDTQVGEGGGAVSGGQRQRICIARALLGRPEMLVLDEPTSALDLLSEARILETLEQLRGSVTMVVVAHRLSTLNVCDRILVLVDGRGVALGTAGELSADGGFYEEALRLSGIHA